MDGEKRRILLIENVKKYRESLKKLLEIDGYEVLTADTVDKGKKILKTQWVHLAIVDVRASKPEVDEPDDESGLDFIMDKRHPSYGIIPRLILTAYPDWGKVRRALAPDENGTTPAVDFLVKGIDAPEEILHKIDETIKRWWNPDLEIDWEATTPICLASFLEPEERWGVEESAPELQGEEADREYPLQLSAQELTALLRRAYREDPQIHRITVRGVRRGHANTFVAFVQVHPRNGGLGRGDVLKCGHRHIIHQEMQNFKNYVRPYTSSILVRTASETAHYAAISYSPIGGQLSACETFKDFYRGSDVESIKDLLGHLFQKDYGLLNRWYVNQRKLDGQSIFAHYRNILEISEQRLKELLNVLPSQGIPDFYARMEGDALIVRIADHSLKVDNFMSFVRDDETWNLPGPYWWGITHGDLNGDNILVDEQEQPWLIDFERTGWGPAVRDFAELEGVIRWELVRTNKMAHIPKFETVLLNAGLRGIQQTMPVPEKEVDDWSADLKKAASIILFLRQIMSDIYGDATEDLYREYLVSLFYYALRFMGKSGITSHGQIHFPQIRKAHALYSASMIAKMAQNGWQEKIEWDSEE